jgi:hypothetical protein
MGKKKEPDDFMADDPSMRVIGNPSRFSGGITIITPAVMATLSAEEVYLALNRHFSGDWGLLDEFDWKANDDASHYGARLVSRYMSSGGTQFFIITEADRSCTIVQMATEY